MINSIDNIYNLLSERWPSRQSRDQFIAWKMGAFEIEEDIYEPSFHPGRRVKLFCYEDKIYIECYNYEQLQVRRKGILGDIILEDVIIADNIIDVIKEINRLITNRKLMTKCIHESLDNESEMKYLEAEHMLNN